MYGGKLRVLPRGTAMVQNYEQMGTVRRFHGWKHDPTLGETIKDPVTRQPKRAGGFVKLEATLPEHVIVVPHTAEYRRHIRCGDLWPADEPTARMVGVKFYPTFGGEHPLGNPSVSKAVA